MLTRLRLLTPRSWLAVFSLNEDNTMALYQDAFTQTPVALAGVVRTPGQPEGQNIVVFVTTRRTSPPPLAHSHSQEVMSRRGSVS